MTDMDQQQRQAWESESNFIRVWSADTVTASAPSSMCRLPVIRDSQWQRQRIDGSEWTLGDAAAVFLSHSSAQQPSRLSANSCRTATPPLAALHELG
ncbi:hypothetical protein GGTG_03184 [Gaeumannomyces tritici R3-111a-1]|uniref:Uncharacterized protein n=1 Tax=Gaeumannomyces tritici (strain R3-111a-1) TaxID=644352 RepID=J3NPH6_GAET3|nr:hypothetical protein GGTG_03184 [Gaeumannomyces tritici R3-111a-1]EJT78081.1 hypothetical protein GGTG_03184 [Gaeumannomyces tritici R3-111a-1]